MKKIYRVSRDSSLEENGVRNVFNVDIKQYDINASYSYRKIPHLKPFQEGLVLPTVKLNKGAKLTDWMYLEPPASRVEVFSERVIDLLCRYNLPKFELKEMPVLGTEKRFFFIHFLEYIDEEVLDWQKSLFVKTNKVDWLNPNSDKNSYIYEELFFSNKNEYQLAVKKIENTKFCIDRKKVKISDDYNYDYAKHSFLHNDLMSSRLKKEIEKEGLTGFLFEEPRLDWSDSYIKKEL